MAADKTIQASLAKLFDQVKNKGEPIELTLTVGGERWLIVNTEAPVATVNETKEAR